MLMKLLSAGRNESRIELLQENNEQDASQQSHDIDCSDEELHRKLTEYESTLGLKKSEIARVSA